MHPLFFNQGLELRVKEGHDDGGPAEKVPNSPPPDSSIKKPSPCPYLNTPPLCLPFPPSPPAIFSLSIILHPHPHPSKTPQRLSRLSAQLACAQVPSLNLLDSNLPIIAICTILMTSPPSVPR